MVIKSDYLRRTHEETCMKKKPKSKTVKKTAPYGYRLDGKPKKKPGRKTAK